MVRLIRDGFVLVVLCSLLVACGGGGGGGGGTNGGISTSNPLDLMKSFSVALKTNDNTTATNLFSEYSKDKNISKWTSLTKEQRVFLGESIEASASSQSLSTSKTRVQFNVIFFDEQGKMIKAPIILVMERGAWKILDF